MTLADDSTRTFTPSRRGVLHAAAWSAPAITIASAAPAFAGSGGGGGQPLSYTSGIFWRPVAGEAPVDEQNYWNILPEGIVWITQITNLGTTALQNVQLDLAVPGTKGFRVLDATELTVVPAVSIFADSPRTGGRVLITLPQVPAGAPVNVTVVVQRPDSVARGTSPTWAMNVTANGGAPLSDSLTITKYADFLGAITP